MYKPGKEGATRIEYRSPDPACNPYLAFAAMLAAGLAGIEGEYELPPEASNNIYEMTEDERDVAGIRSLPEDLHEAIRLAADSTVLRDALGEHVHEFLIRNKRQEWDGYKAYVSPYETEPLPPDPLARSLGARPTFVGVDFGAVEPPRSSLPDVLSWEGITWPPRLRGCADPFHRACNDRRPGGDADRRTGRERRPDHLGGASDAGRGHSRPQLCGGSRGR